MINIKKLLILLIILITTPLWSFDNFIFTTESGIQSLTGQTHKIVYDDIEGSIYHINQLDWGQNATLVGGKISLTYIETLFISYSVYTSIVPGDSEMEDTDWLGYIEPSYLHGHDPSEWTHYSLSTVKMDVQLYDLIFGIKSPKLFNIVKFDGGIGFRNEERYWVDKPQLFIYSTVDGFRDSEWEFDGVTGINYNLSIEIPYYMFGITTEFNKFSARFYGEYSTSVNINSVDNHLLRGIIFIDTMKNYTYWAIGLDTSWEINSKSYIKLSGNYNVILEGNPGTTVLWDLNYSDPEPDYYSDIAGFAQESLLVTLSYGLRY